jgi:hypothetical protein
MAMLAQVVQVRTNDPDGARPLLERLARDVAPVARGSVGVTEDGVLFAVFLMDREDAVQLDDVPGWVGLSRFIERDVDVRTSRRVAVFGEGASPRAGFVQVVQGRLSDLELALEHLAGLQVLLAEHLPALVGSVTVLHAPDGFTRVLYFSSEDEARATETDFPPALQDADEQARRFLVGEPTFLDFRHPVVFPAD